MSKCYWCGKSAHHNPSECPNYGTLSMIEAENKRETIPEELHKFSTGAVRCREHARYDLITPIGMRRLAERYALGSKKYGDYNWEKGMPISELLNHAIAHINKYLLGDRSDDHLAGAAWGLMSALHSEEMWPHLNTNLRKENGVPPNPELKVDIKLDPAKITPEQFRATFNENPK